MKNNYKTKIKVNFSIDKTINEKFKLLADKKSINKSKLIADLINKWCDEQL